MPATETSSGVKRQTFLRYPEMAARLGITPRCPKNWVSDRLVPYIKFQRTVLFDPDKVEAALRQKERGTKHSTSCRSSRHSKRQEVRA